jgi:hypothetical protein
MIAATNNWVLAWDNLSRLPVWLSDAICTLSTGGGLSTRELFSDSDEIIFDAQRPVVLTGIEELAVRGDLTDRTIPLILPRLPDHARRTETELWRCFDDVRPRLFGSLLDVVVGALRDLPATRLDRLPRMADFALWASSAESALGWRSGTFLSAYEANRASANDLVLDSSDVATLLRDSAGDEWAGTASQLLMMLNEKVDDATRKRKDWPSSPQALSGLLRRLAPNLRLAGIELDFEREGHSRRRVIRFRSTAESHRPPVRNDLASADKTVDA